MIGSVNGLSQMRGYLSVMRGGEVSISVAKCILVKYGEG